jgi:hypothetical protein
VSAANAGRGMSPGARFAVAAALVLSIPLVAGVRAWHQGSADLAASDLALQSGDLDGAIAAARRAAFAEVPLVGADAAGYARLEAMAHDAEGRNDEDHALKAWAAVRAAALGSDGLFSRDAELHTASHALARLYIKRAHEAAAAAGPQLTAAPIPDEATLAGSLGDATATTTFAARARRALGFTAAALLLGGLLLLFVRRGGRRTLSPPSSDTSDKEEADGATKVPAPVPR